MFTQQVEHIAHSYFEALDSAVSLSCSILLRHGDYAQLIKLSVNARNYLDPQVYLKDASAVAFLKKSEVTIQGLDPESVAKASWLDCEKQCFKTNRKLFDDFGDPSFESRHCDPRFDNFVKRARSIVVDLIGTDPGFIEGRLGPGATLSDSYGSTDVINKFTSTPSLADHSISLLTTFKNAWSRKISDAHTVIETVRSNAYFCVPKTALTHRSCAKEPSINSFVQLGLGSLMRSRLRRRGIDLVRAQSFHKDLARQSSIDGLNATIDLSNASDNVSHYLVKILMPELWYNSLDQARSRRTSFSGHDYVLEKFSSMGNGFTFELETVLFFAIVCSVSPDLTPGVNVHVYGDDIIVPTRYTRDILAALRYWGFSSNVDKTFVDGPFRESCGGDYFLGSDVRPIFLKKVPNHATQYITLHNQLRRHSRRFICVNDSDLFGCVYRHVISFLPREIAVCRGPEELGDICLHSEENTWRYRWRNSIRVIRTYIPIASLGRNFSSYDARTQYAAALYGLSLIHNRVIGNGVGGYRLSWTAYS